MSKSGTISTINVVQTTPENLDKEAQPSINLSRTNSGLYDSTVLSEDTAAEAMVSSAICKNSVKSVN